jgi:tRNA(adenine34) deaminase
MADHERFMRLALTLARQSASDAEVPVGCVIVAGSGEVVGRGRNLRQRSNNAVAHAEIEAIEQACAALGDRRLTDCSLYVTLEPCPMCAGAIILARLPKLFFGAREPIYGACGSIINLFMEGFPCDTQVTGGILEDECGRVLREFFEDIRGNRRKE